MAGVRISLSLRCRVLAGIFVCLAAVVRAEDFPVPFVSATLMQPMDETNPNANPTLGTGDAPSIPNLPTLSEPAKVVGQLSEPVTTVTLSKSTVLESPAAVFVITQEMIRRSGATTIPEALRMAPGVHVGNLDGNFPVVSIRGFGSSEISVGLPTSERLLVLIDGRDLYDPVIGGVYWMAHDLVLQDIDRIEVIRGPGATLWGANAVNGVINIITKSTQETQGPLVQALGGSETKQIMVARLGGEIDKDTHYRIFTKYKDVDNQYVPGGQAHDGYTDFRGGFRIDSTPDDTDAFTLQGDIFTNRAGQPITLDGRFEQIPAYGAYSLISGGNVVGKWTRTFDDDSKFRFMSLYDRYSAIGATLKYARDTYTLDANYQWNWIDTHHLTVGGQYRIVHDMSDVSDAFGVRTQFDPQSRTYDVTSALIQDEITLTEDITFIAGTKMEVNDFTGFEIQPSGRILKNIDERRVAWSSISRAIRRPNRIDENFMLTSPLLNLGNIRPEIVGNDHLKADALVAYEVGYREQTTDWFSWDLATFYNVYDNLRVYGVTDQSIVDGQLVQTVTPVNAMTGESYGAELATTLTMTETWSITTSYSYLQIQLHSDDPDRLNNSKINESAEGRSPHNIVYLRNSWSPTTQWDVDQIFRYVDSLPSDRVPSYFQMDLRLAWRPKPRLELAVVGQNLLDGSHPEYGGPSLFGPRGLIIGQRTEVQRGVYASLTYTY